MCKFENNEDAGYQLVVGAIQDYVEIVKKTERRPRRFVGLAGLVQRECRPFLPVYIPAYVNDI